MVWNGDLTDGTPIVRGRSGPRSKTAARHQELISRALREIRVFVSNLGEIGATPALVKTLAFNEARLDVIAENIANGSTPGYRTRQLDERSFQRALRAAIDRKDKDPQKPFVVRSGTEVTTGDRGQLQVTPSLRPAENALFHDGTNMSLEKQMADLAETSMMHELAATLLRNNVEGMRKAIRGRIN